jgi:DNA-binding transcriptional LysR family regulator
MTQLGGQIVDLNLLVALDALLAEHSVTRAAERLATSPAAMSRTLGRLRRVLGDPVLVRAGQNMVPTPRAVALRDDVRAVVARSTALLAPAGALDLAELNRTFTVQTSDLLLVGLAAPLLADIGHTAPGVTVRFLPETLEDTPALREGRVDVEVGVLDHADPETRTERLTSIRLSAAARADHPLFHGPIGPAAFAAAAHIGISRRFEIPLVLQS